jgi:hypothetical protein
MIAQHIYGPREAGLRDSFPDLLEIVLCGNTDTTVKNGQNDLFAVASACSMNCTVELAAQFQVGTAIEKLLDDVRMTMESCTV